MGICHDANQAVPARSKNLYSFLLITSMWVYPEGTPNFVQVYIKMLRAKGMREPKRTGKLRTLLIFFGISANAT